MSRRRLRSWLRSSPGAAAAAVLLCAPGAPAAVKWKVDRDVSGGPAVLPEVAIDDAGGATAAFRRVEVRDGQQVAGSGRVFAAHRERGKGFARAYQVAGKPSEVRELAATSDGTTVLLYFVGTDGCYGDRLCPGTVRVSIRRPGGRFGTGKTLAAHGHQAQLGIDARGRPTVVWLEGARQPRQLFAAELTRGGWRVQRIAVGDFHRPELGVGERGEALIVWTVRQDAVRASFRRAGGRFGSVTTLEPTGFVTDPSAAVDAKGNAIAAFTGVGSSGGNQSVFALERRAGRGFGEPRLVHSNAYGPRVLLGPGGDAAIEYKAFTGGPFSQELLVAYRSARGRWADPRTAAGPDKYVRVEFGRGLLALARGATDLRLQAYVRRASGKFALERALRRAGSFQVFDASARGRAVAAWHGPAADSPVAVALREP